MSYSRFTVRWVRNYGCSVLNAGYAVYDFDRRITKTWPDHAEAEQHRKKIAEYYLRWGW